MPIIEKEKDEMSKITNDQILDWEANSLIEAIGNCIELNDLFLERYCNQEFQELMKDIPERDREFVISGLDINHYWNGSPAGNNDQHIWIDVSEIEYQFEGNPEDIFDEPEDLTINGDLAYLYVGYGLSIEFDKIQLIEAVNDYKETYQ